MLETNLGRDGEATLPSEATEDFAQETASRAAPLNGHVKSVKRRPASIPTSAGHNGHGVQRDSRHALAVFCFEDPESAIGQYVSQSVAALARRQVPVHLYAGHDFKLDVSGVRVHAVGESDAESLIGQVQDFARRACNAFLQHFPNGSANVTLLGYEWSAVPALSILRGIKSLSALLSLHSLERQRSAMDSELSQRIDEIEHIGLREASKVLIHEPRCAEVARQCVPECGERVVEARQMFPMQQFENDLDPGAIKARYEVGPVDPTILFVGDLSERYGSDLLVKALPAVLKNHKQARLVIVGEGSLYWPLRVYARYLLLEHAVRLPGSIEGQALFELIQAADIIAVPSREPTPWWPILAAWAGRRPVVTTHDAARGLVEHGQDSVLCYPSENSLVWGIERVLYDAEFGRGLALNGRAKLEERFGWNSVAEQIQQLMAVGQAGN